VSSPISGDKLVSALDVKSSQTERRNQQAQASDNTSTTDSASKPTTDSVQLTHSQVQTESRPLSETVTNSQQADNALQALLANIQKSPEQAMSAQAQVPQSQADALLSAVTA